jgi:O-antigen/teichoic acid export membrane protein
VAEARDDSGRAGSPPIAAPILGPPVPDDLQPVDPGALPRGFMGRAAWSFAGQAISSGSNFLLSVMVLAVASARDFATFSICVTTYALVLQTARASVAVPATLLQTGGPEGDDGQERAALGVTVGMAALVAAVMLAASPLAGNRRGQLIVLAAFLPLLLLQDALRYVCYARGRPSVAAWGDGLWLIVQLVGSVVLLASGSRSATALLAIWAAAGAVSGVLLARRVGLGPSLPAALAWLGQHRALWQRLLAEFLVAQSSQFVVYYGLAIVAGAEELGRVKGAQTLLGPVIVLILGGSALGVPESVRAAADRDRLRGVASRLSLFLVGAALICGALAFALVPLFGPWLFPNAWETARPLIPALSVFAAGIGATTGATSALRALGENPWLLRVRTWTGLVVGVLGLAASAWIGAEGALVALTAVEWSVTILAWRRLLALLPRRQSGPPPPTDQATQVGTTTVT